MTLFPTRKFLQLNCFKIVMLLVGSMQLAPAVLAKKTAQPVYQDPFDIAGGGAALTRASQDAVIFANPALMPWGSTIYRYSGYMPTVRYTPQSIAFGQALSTSETDEYIDLLFAGEEHVHAGVTGILSVITKYFAMGVLHSSLVDLEANEHGSATGGPSVDFVNETYGGVAMSFAGMANSWFSYGMTTKYLVKTEPEVSVAVADRAGIEQLSDSSTLLDQYAPGTGFGVDLGMLFFAQGRHVDYRLALKADDVGGMGFTGEQEPFKQTFHVGNSITFHGTVHAIHLALDLRDVTDEYKEKPFKKVYTGVKLMLQNHLGFALGLYHGIPSFGVRLDLWAVKLGITQYGVEMKSVIGEKRRNISLVYLSLGW